MKYRVGRRFGQNQVDLVGKFLAIAVVALHGAGDVLADFTDQAQVAGLIRYLYVNEQIFHYPFLPIPFLPTVTGNLSVLPRPLGKFRKHDAGGSVRTSI